MDLKTYIIRGLSALLWVVVILFFVYLPAFMPYVQEKAITVFCWSDTFDPDYIKRFEKTSGIRVNLRFYETNEELLLKLRATNGRGYDLIIPSDYAIAQLIKDKLLQKINKNKLTFVDDINPYLMGHYFDPTNTYCLPLEWAIFGLGIDREYFGNKIPEATWGLLFNPELMPTSVAMVNDPWEAVLLAAFYLFGPQKSLTQAQLTAIKELLIRQKPRVHAYTELRADYFLSTKNIPLAVSSSSYIWRAMRDFSNISFLIPQEGSFITIEHVALPISSKKADLVYQFLNFIYDPKAMAHNFKTFVFFPSTLSALNYLDLGADKKEMLELLTLNPQKMEKLHFFQRIIPHKSLNKIWIAVKNA